MSGPYCRAVSELGKRKCLPSDAENPSVVVKKRRCVPGEFVIQNRGKNTTDSQTLKEMVGPRKAAKRRNVEFGNTECLTATKHQRFGKAKRSPQHGRRAALFVVQRRKGSVTKAAERCCIYKDDANDERRVARLLMKLGVPIMTERQMKKLSSSGSGYLGAGSYGSCCKVRDPESGDELVIKTFPELGLQSLVKEAAMLTRLRMEGVQGLVGVCVKTRQLVSDYAGVTADSYFNAGAKRRDKLSVLLQVSRTLQKVNKRGFAHNDLSGRNVCVRAGSSGPEVTVIDLGLARRVRTTGIYPRVADPALYPWLAPELLAEHHDTASCHENTDAYSLGYFIKEALFSDGFPFRRPQLAGVFTWMRGALSPCSHQRPRLGLLIARLEVLLKPAAAKDDER